MKRDLSNCGKWPQMERCDGVHGTESEQITEVDEYLSGETRKDEEAKDKELLSIPIGKQTKVARKRRSTSEGENGVVDREKILMEATTPSCINCTQANTHTFLEDV